MTTSGPAQLRVLREQRGWTQQDVAEQLARLAWIQRRERAGVNADMVAKWERGVKCPSRRYRDLLALLYGVEITQLRAAPTAPDPPVPRPAVASEGASLVATLGDTAALLDRLGPAGAVLQPKMFDAWKDEIMRRRVLLKLIGLAPAGLAMPASNRRPAQPTPETVTGLHELAGRYQGLYHSTAPHVLMTPVLAHLETIREVLRQNLTATMRRKLLANRARVATLAGRLAFFDLRDAMGARSYYNLALESAREAGDHLLAAAALGHTAFIPAEDHGYAAALDYLRGAAGYVGRQPHGPMSSWLAAIEAEMHANAGSTAEALAAIDRARAVLGNPGLFAQVSWFDYYDATRLDGFAGYTNLRAGRYEEARATLTAALDRLPQDAVKQRAVFLCDLATVHLHDGDLDEACRVATEAADQLHRAGYATGSGRLQKFRTAVAPWGDSRAVRQLDQQLALIA